MPTAVTANVSVPTLSVLSFRPNPIGVNQLLLVNVWVAPAPNVDRMFTDFKVTITKPDGTKEVKTMNSYTDDGTSWFDYTPDQVGEWTLKFEFLGMYLPAGRYLNGYIVTNGPGTDWPLSVYFKPSETSLQTLTVQTEMVLSWPASPLARAVDSDGISTQATTNRWTLP